LREVSDPTQVSTLLPSPSPAPPTHIICLHIAISTNNQLNSDTALLKCGCKGTREGGDCVAGLLAPRSFLGHFLEAAFRKHPRHPPLTPTTLRTHRLSSCLQQHAALYASHLSSSLVADEARCRMDEHVTTSQCSEPTGCSTTFSTEALPQAWNAPT
jgi:hypothetical protein